MTTTPDPSIEQKIIPGPNELVFYTNMAEVRATPEEMIIHFGLREEEPLVGIGIAKVIMSLSHAKRLAAAILKTVGRYEETFGDVPFDEVARLRPDRREAILKKLSEEGREND